MCLYIDAEEHELGDLGEPTNYKAALLDTESDKWLNAMNVEMQSMKDNKFLDLVELLLMAKPKKGYTQTLGIDYEDTFSPVADIRAIRILIAIVAYYDYEIWQMDVKTAFLNGYLNEEVYMEQPKVLSIQNIQTDIHEYLRDMFLVYGGVVDWRVAKQRFSLLPSAEMSIIAALMLLRESRIEKVHTDDNLADPFTKALAFPKHSELTRNIGMLPASSLM
ncbi:putative retrotransposon ty1-copia subclass protein [Tanacetum coccineum]